MQTRTRICLQVLCCNSLYNTSTAFLFSFQRHVQLCLGCLDWKNDPVCFSWIFFATIHNRCHWCFCYYRYLMAFCNRTSHSLSWKFCSLGHWETLHSYFGVSLHSKIAPVTEDTQGSTAFRPAAQPHSLQQRGFQSLEMPQRVLPSVAQNGCHLLFVPRQCRETDSCCQIFCSQTCPFLALKALTELTWGLEFTSGTFDFVIGNGMLVPLLS